MNTTNLDIILDNLVLPTKALMDWAKQQAMRLVDSEVVSKESLDGKQIPGWDDSPQNEPGA